MSAEPHDPTAHPAEERSTLDELMTASQVAALLLMPTSTVNDYARRGLLPSITLGKHRRFLRSHVESAIATLAGAPAETEKQAPMAAPSRPPAHRAGLRHKQRPGQQTLKLPFAEH